MLKIAYSIKGFLILKDLTGAKTVYVVVNCQFLSTLSDGRSSCLMSVRLHRSAQANSYLKVPVFGD